MKTVDDRLLLHFITLALPLSLVIGSPSDTMPCCLETLGVSTCQNLKMKRGFWFKRRCKENADFGMIQCCHTCGNEIAQLGVQLFANGEQSPQCYDRHNESFCLKFLYSMDLWSLAADTRLSCQGEGAALAFRICRKTCGFCNFELYLLKRHDPNCPMIG